MLAVATGTGWAARRVHARGARVAQHGEGLALGLEAAQQALGVHARVHELDGREPVHGLDELSAVLGIPEWWPTGSRVAIAIAHGSNSNLDDPLVEYIHRELTERRFLTLRFNFPFAEAGKRAKDILTHYYHGSTLESVY